MLRDILEKGAAELGIVLDDGTLGSFEKYYAILCETNKVMNLTAITEEDEAARLHFLDSLALLGAEKLEGCSLIDVGSGAGFPGLPVKLAESSVRLTMLDALRKRVDFLQSLCLSCGVEEVTCLHARAEEASRGEMRESFDFATARAVSRLNVLCELCMPFVKVGGAFLPMKSDSCDEELEEAKPAIKKLGGKVERIHEYTVPGTDIVRRVIVIRKVSPTPERFPRRFAKIQKEPIK